MLSEERVKHMTKMAILEERESRKLHPVMRYRKKDYIEISTIIHVFLGSLAYAVLYFAVVGLLFFTVMTNVHLFGVIMLIVLGLLLYVVYMYFYLKSIKTQYEKKYDEGVEIAKKLRKDYQILEQMYQEEEQQKSPEGWC